VKWCNERSEKEGLSPCYRVGSAVYRAGENDAVTCDWNANGYRLPSEAEWEKAARGGLEGKRFPWGDTISHSQANFWNSAGESYQSGTTGPHPVWSNNDDGNHPYVSLDGSTADFPGKWSFHGFACVVFPRASAAKGKSGNHGSDRETGKARSPLRQSKFKNR